MSEDFLRGRVVAEGGVIDDGVVTTRDGVITAVRTAAPNDPPAQPGTTILPGLVDVHCHGGGGASFPDSDLDAAMEAVLHHRRHGITSLFASLVSAPAQRLLQQTALLADLYVADEIAGIHVEGPFISVARCGAQDPKSIIDGDPTLLAELIEVGRGAVKSMTLAPETPRFGDLIVQMQDSGVVPSIGHTNASAVEVRRAIEMIDGGPVSATHLFNGMPAFHHRSPGPAGACLAAAGRGTMVLEMIGDGVHLADDTVRMAFDLVGPDQIAFVSDAMAAAGMADGRYRLGASDVEVAGGTARLAEGSHAIAGGTSNIMDIVRRAVAGGVRLRDAVTAGSATPARLMNMHDVGAIAIGARADIVVTDADLRPIGVMRRGDWVKGVA